MEKTTVKLPSKSLKSNAKDMFFITFGIFLYAVGYCAYTLPEKLVMGGVAGASALIYYATNIPAGTSVLALNILMLVIAMSALTKQFFWRTIVGVGILSFMISVLQPFFATFPIMTPGEDKFMHVLIAGVLCGAGLGIVFSHNGSTGGTDILTMLLNKYFRLSFGRAMQFVDCIIISSSYILFHSMETIIYGIVFTITATVTCDYIVNGTRQTVQFLIISKKHKEIADVINHRVNRGVTVVDGKGWYSQNDVKMLIVLTRKYESQDVFNLINEIDPDALVSQTFCHGVFGEGFDKIK
ncbi:YitT family protein [Prevotella sp.]|uniref:YitT family protein n=1 Tax=Prevotella sp. TaxID=59823 RepID=UPI0027E29A1B|nr:YitT family protein [uncultured Prevotella sp.]